ncbi:hypothetical protein EDD22DRAFT_893058 [Suillus occidentalis]|nr:hypothetical protein EDD22DRAFT_893058 [Suillus occidentalis]
MSTFSQLLRPYAYTPQTSRSLKRKHLPENSDCLPVTVRKPRALKITSQESEQRVSHRPRSESLTANQQQVPTGESSIYFTPLGKAVSTDQCRRKGPRKLLDAVEIVVKSALSTHDESLEVSKRMKKKCRLEPGVAHQPPAKDDKPSEVEMKIKCFLTPIPDEVRSTLMLPTPSSRPRKRRKVVPSAVSLHQSTALSSKSKATSKVATQQTDVIHRTCPDHTTPKSVANLVSHESLLSFCRRTFSHTGMSAFPTYRQDLFNDLIGYIANAKPILIQAAVSDNPWQLLIAVKLLNVTTGRYAIPVFWKLMDRWPIPRDNDEIVYILRPLGLYNKRAAWLKEISQRYIDDPPTDILRPSKCRLEIPARLQITVPTYVNPRKRKNHDSPKRTRKMTIPYPPTPISHFPGVGRYALDSYRIFCTSNESEEWKQIMPEDKELIRYLWANEERKIWYPDGVGVVKDVDIPYLFILVDELMEQLEPDEFWGPTDFISG